MRDKEYYKDNFANLGFIRLKKILTLAWINIYPHTHTHKYILDSTNKTVLSLYLFIKNRMASNTRAVY